jgi:hypothetical protein
MSLFHDTLKNRAGSIPAPNREIGRWYSQKPKRVPDQYPSTFTVSMKEKVLELTSIPYSSSWGFPHTK